MMCYLCFRSFSVTEASLLPLLSTLVTDVEFVVRQHLAEQFSGLSQVSIMYIVDEEGFFPFQRFLCVSFLSKLAVSLVTSSWSTTFCRCLPN